MRYRSALAILAVLTASTILAVLGLRDLDEPSPPVLLWAGSALLCTGGSVWPFLRSGSALRSLVRLVTAFSGALTIVSAAGTIPGSSSSMAVLVAVATLAVFLLQVVAAGASSPRPSPHPAHTESHRPPGIRIVEAWNITTAGGTALSAVLVAVAVTAPLGTLGARMGMTSLLVTVILIAGEAVLRRRPFRLSLAWKTVSAIILAVGVVIALPAVVLALVDAASRMPVWARPQPSLPFLPLTVWIPVTVAAATLAATTRSLSNARHRGSATGVFTAGCLLTAWTAGAVQPSQTLSALLLAVTAVAAATTSTVVTDTRAVGFATVGTAVSALSALLLATPDPLTWFVVAPTAAVSCLATALPGQRASGRPLMAAPRLLAGGCFALVVLMTTHGLLDQTGASRSSTSGPALLTAFTASVLVLSATLRRHHTTPFSALIAPLSSGALILCVVDVLDTRQAEPNASVAILTCALIVEAVSLRAARSRARATVLITAALIPPTAILAAVQAWGMTDRHIWGAPELIAVAASAALAFLGWRVPRRLAARHGFDRVRQARLLWNSTLSLSCVITVPAAVTTGRFGAVHFALLAVLPLVFTLPIAASSPVRPLPRGVLSSLVLIWFSLYLATEGAVSSPAVSGWLATLICLAAALIALSFRVAAHEGVPQCGRILLGTTFSAVLFAPAILSAFRTATPGAALSLSGSALLCASVHHVLVRRPKRMPYAAVLVQILGVLLALASVAVLTFGALDGRVESGFPTLVVGASTSVSLVAAGSAVRGTSAPGILLRRSLVSGGILVFTVPQALLVSRDAGTDTATALTVAAAITICFLALSPLSSPVATTTRALAALSGALLLAAIVSSTTASATLPTLMFTGALAADGLFQCRRHPELSSWATLGPGMVAMLGTGTILVAGRPDAAPVTTLVVACAVCMLLGMRTRAHAPRALGALGLAGSISLVPTAYSVDWATPLAAWPLLGVFALVAGHGRSVQRRTLVRSDAWGRTERRLG